MITIHNFGRGARGVRVFWQCEEMGLAYQVATVTFPPGADFRALNPLCTVPFLQDDGGVAINESVAIMLYLARKYGPTALLPESDGATLARVLQMTVFGEATIGMGLNPILEASYSAPEDEERNWSVRAQEGRVERAVDYAAAILGDQPYLAGSQFTLADISVCTALGMWCGALGHSLPDKLEAWRQRMAARPAFQRAVARQTPAK